MGTDREGDIMQLTNTTDYAIRIVCYLASENKVITTAELSRELNIPASYIPRACLKIKNCTKHVFLSPFHDRIKKKGAFICQDVMN